MIYNIIDNRNKPYRWTLVDAVVEPTWHDNDCNDSDQAKPWDEEIDHEDRSNVSVMDAVRWASNLPFPVTLYLYDKGEKDK